MWTDRVCELVEGFGRYALGELGDVTTLWNVLVMSSRSYPILFDFRDPRPSSSF